MNLNPAKLQANFPPWGEWQRAHNKEADMVFRRGQKVKIYRRSDDESWEDYMDTLVGRHGIITDPDTLINDPDALVEVSLENKGTYRLPQDCLRELDP